MPSYGMVIDITRCTGCHSCFLACRDEYCGNDHPPYSASQPSSGHFWMKVSEKERGTFPKVKVSYLPTPCMHCQDAPCMAAASAGAVYRRPDGIVLIDPEKASGQKDIVEACPYRVIYWNAEREAPQKCTFCAHLLDRGWKEPRCVESCPTGALLFGDLDDPESEIAKVVASGEIEPFHPEYGTSPRIHYAGLPKRFIAGEVVLSDQKDECAAGVKVTLRGESDLRSAVTDCYGDFEFEGLAPDSEYVVAVRHEGYAPQELKVRTRVDVNLGTIFLNRNL